VLLIPTTSAGCCTSASRGRGVTCTCRAPPAADAGGASSFLGELGIHVPAPRAGSGSGGGGEKVVLDEGDPLVAALRTWRGEESRRIGKPAYVVFDNKTLVAIAAARPGSLGALAEVSGVGPAKLERYGDAVLDVVSAESAD
jgi:ATP-dependent DNA helicase RecQ